MTNELTTQPSDTKKRVQKAFGIRLQAMRKKREMTQEQLAEKIERSVDMISGMERGLVFPSLETLVRIAAAMGCSVEELFDLDLNARTRSRGDLDEVIALLQDKPQPLIRTAIRQIKALIDFAEAEKKINSIIDLVI